MNIDFIKWMIGYGEGFEVITDDLLDFEISIPLDNILLQSWCNHFRTDMWKQIYYPLLLQRAIEGINRGEGYLIFQDFSEIRIEHNDNNGFEKYYDYGYGIDQAKEAALKYIYEQEQIK